MEEKSRTIDPERPDSDYANRELKSVRRDRLVMGTGVGGGIGLAIALIAGMLYKDTTGNQLDQEISLAIGSVIGSLGSTIAICLQDIRTMLWALIDRDARKDD